MRELYAPFQRNHERLILMDVKSAELTKYAANTMLATRISFMNELANLAEKLGADIELVRKGIGSDPRIGFHFLYPGVGYGGSCFPKDVQASDPHGAEAGQDLQVLQAVETPTKRRRRRARASKIARRLGQDLGGKTFALWGLAFKPNTDDMREAPSLVLITELLARGASVRAYDPVAVHEAQRMLGDNPRIRYAVDADGGARRRRCAGHRHRVEGIPQPRFRGDQGRAEDAGDFRRPQSLRPGDAAQGRTRILRHRQVHEYCSRYLPPPAS
jgi:UDPglucose 6-dehydrogenase